MYIIAGLGNPDKKYEGTRHNAGFEAVDKLADKLGVKISEKKFKGLCQTVSLNGDKYLLLKPLTYMNNSGESIRAAADFYKIAPENIIILYDDINFECGRMRIRGSGSAGGHNGMKSIIQHLGTQDFARVRVGIGNKPPKMDLADYVLGHFSRDEEKVIQDAAKEAALAVTVMIESGVDAAMNRFNVNKNTKE